VSEHPSVDELADAAEGLLPAEQAAVVFDHVAGCADCQDHSRALVEVREMLAQEPMPAVPPAVAGRLADTIRAEQLARTPSLHLVGGSGQPRARALAQEHSGDSGGSVPAELHPGGRAPRPTLGSFGADLPSRRLHWLRPALVAAVVALLVGFGGYVLSARAGLNEPPVVAAVNASELGPDAGAVERRIDLDPHRFTRAWQCARAATSGRIVGIAATTVDGTPALLVYIRSSGTTQVTLVTGCGTEPSAGPSAVLSR